MIPEDLLELFEDVSETWLVETTYTYYKLKGTGFTYVHREYSRWIGDAGIGIMYPSFEHVLDNVNEEIQTQLLFHLDYFTGEVENG